MPSKPVSRSPVLRVLSAVFATIFLYYAYIYIFDPLSTVQVFEFDRTPTAEERYFFDALLALLGAKVFFVASAIYAASLLASPKLLGLIMLAASGMAVIDGFVVKSYVGHGEWNHWAYAQIVAGIGMLLLGVLHRVV